MFTTRNKRDVFVAKNLTRTTLAATDYPTSMAIGEVFVMGYNPAATVNKERLLNTTGGTWNYATYSKIRIGMKLADGTLRYSDWIEGNKVRRYEGKIGFDAQEQIYHVGYNGSTGSIDTTAGTRQTVNVEYKGDKAMWSEQVNSKFFTTPYDATPTQKEIAQSLSAQINYDLVNGGGTVYAEMRNSGTAADWTSAGTVAVTFGSDIITLSATSVDAQVVGAVLRLGYGANSLDPYTGASLNGASASGVGVTVPVYIVTAIPTTDSSLTTTQVRVHTPFQGPTAATLDATSGNAGLVTPGTDYGFSVTTKPMTATIDTFPYFKQKFDLTFNDMGTTTVTKTQESKRGNGVSELVKEDEYQNNDGALNNQMWPTNKIFSMTTAVDGTLYGTVVIEHFGVAHNGFGNDGVQDKQIIIYMPYTAKTSGVGSTVTNQWAVDGTNNESLIDVLNGWFSTATGAFPAVALV